ncbi:acetolactate decarboxylase [Cysteiniphilum sp. QT6929]|uniref:acetolactate decarboxylase n=1 Tax=Cysteiniphilum sp. QT6929 TaxID=2975055 RepID=UPI0024B388E8|nr:acetolactate decarboxylase [Cysteiniphilum sp. QT6929]WHN66040.1 acetolactate decarboxylase [Cysteiniphilum sp. QT6929]
MSRMIKKIGLTVALLATASASVFAKDVPLYQYGTITALMSGNYHSVINVKSAKASGNDFGLGAGAGLGEVIVLDGKYYLANMDGKFTQMKPESGLSYLTAVDFKPLKKLSFDINKSIELTTFQQQLLTKLANNQLTYAVKLTGTFKEILARSEKIDKSTNTPLVEWLKEHEHRFSYHDVQGTMVMFFSPKYTEGFGVPGFHAHFVTADKKSGGHVLSAEIEKVKVEVMPIDAINLRVGDVKNTAKEADLTQLHKIENAQ